MKFSTLQRALALATLGCASLAAQAAGPYTSLTIFGDSLSDTGNVFLYSGGLQPPAGQPYAGGAFSNGPVWTDLLADSLGQPLAALPSLAGGTNYAWAGARTGDGGIPPVLAQVAVTGLGLWGGTVAADPTGLYVLVAGGNDMRDARSAFPGATPADEAGRQTAANQAASNLNTALVVLASKGAKNVLISSVPDLGATPEALYLDTLTPGIAAASSDASARFNAQVPSLLAAGASYGLNMSFFDMAGVANAIRNDALFNGGAVYGITNVFTPCAGFTGSIGIGCDVSAYSDALHPSARTHEIFAAAAMAAVVPEPASMLLMAMGIVALVGVARRRAA